MRQLGKIFATMLGLNETDPVSTVAETLRLKIATGVLAPGERVFEAQLARELSVGRPHVREAARLLERERLLISRPNLGFLVREMTVGEFIDLIDVRIGVERHAVRHVIKRGDLEDILDELSQIVGEIKNFVASDDIEGEADADLRFHRLLVNYSGNKLLSEIFTGLAVQLRIAMRMMGAADREDWSQFPQQHRDLVEALRSRDAHIAESAVEKHIEITWSRTLDALRAKAEVPLSFMASSGKIRLRSLKRNGVSRILHEAAERRS